MKNYKQLIEGFVDGCPFYEEMCINCSFRSFFEIPSFKREDYVNSMSNAEIKKMIDSHIDSFIQRVKYEQTSKKQTLKQN
jgi:hypothetical protein